jgi:DNA polymerase-3 subunit beta
MKIRIEKNNLLKAIFKAQGIIDKKTTQGILAHFLVETCGKSGIKITCTDYDVTLISNVEADVIEEGRAAINGRNLFEIIRNIQTSEIMLKKLPNNWVELVGGNAVFKIVGLMPEDYPKIAEPPDMQKITISKDTLMEMVDRTSFCMSTDEARLNINGVYLNIIPEDKKEYRFLMVATDGHRLSMFDRMVSLDTSEFKEVECTIHRRGITELKRFLEGEEPNLEMGFYHKNILFSYGASYLQVRQIEEVFPNWKMVIPKDFKIRIRMNRKELAETVTRVAQISSERSGMIKIGLMDGKMKIYTENPELGEGTDEIAVDFSGDELEIAYNFRYILDALSAINNDNIEMNIKDSTSATKIVSAEEEGVTEIIMPMRL